MSDTLAGNNNGSLLFSLIGIGLSIWAFVLYKNLQIVPSTNGCDAVTIGNLLLAFGVITIVFNIVDIFCRCLNLILTWRRKETASTIIGGGIPISLACCLLIIQPGLIIAVSLRVWNSTCVSKLFGLIFTFRILIYQIITFFKRF
jgi:hypothetical protein